MKWIFLSDNIAVDPKVVCHFSGKPSTTRPSKAKYLLYAVLRSNVFGDVANARCEILFGLYVNVENLFSKDDFYY